MCLFLSNATEYRRVSPSTLAVWWTTCSRVRRGRESNSKGRWFCRTKARNSAEIVFFAARVWLLRSIPIYSKKKFVSSTTGKKLDFRPSSIFRFFRPFIGSLGNFQLSICFPFVHLYLSVWWFFVCVFLCFGSLILLLCSDWRKKGPCTWIPVVQYRPRGQDRSERTTLTIQHVEVDLKLSAHQATDKK